MKTYLTTTLITLSMILGACGSESKKSPQTRAIESDLGFPGGSLPTSKDPSLIDYADLQDGGYQLDVVQVLLTHQDSGSSYLTSFRLDHQQNELVEASCQPDQNAIRNASKIWGAMISFDSPSVFRVDQGRKSLEGEYEYSLTAEMTSSKQECQLSVYAYSGSQSSFKVMQIFTLNEATQDGPIYSIPFGDGKVRAVFQRAADGGLRLLYEGSAEGMKVLGALRFKRVDQVQAQQEQEVIALSEVSRMTLELDQLRTKVIQAEANYENAKINGENEIEAIEEVILAKQQVNVSLKKLVDQFTGTRRYIDSEGDIFEYEIFSEAEAAEIYQEMEVTNARIEDLTQRIERSKRLQELGQSKNRSAE